MRKKKQNKRNDELEDVDDFDEFDDQPAPPSRTVYLVGEITEKMIKNVTRNIISLSEIDIRAPITLMISTRGGSLEDTFMLYDLMRFIKTPIHTVALGKVMSAGCLLLAAGAKGQRSMGKNAVLMYHAGWDYSHGTVWEIRANLEVFEKQEKLYDRCFSDETGLSIQDVEKLYDKNGPTRDHFLSAEESLKLGIIDHVI